MIPVPLTLPRTCERALFERFLRAEAMALWSVRSAQRQDVPPHVLQFLRRHEKEEQRHLQMFETLIDVRALEKTALPRVPTQWWALAVHLYGYEALGLEFARLLASVRPDLSSVLEDEEAHVGFFEHEVRQILQAGDGAARNARAFAFAWWRRLPPTVERYLRHDSLAQYRVQLRSVILASIERRFTAVGLFDAMRGPSPTASPYA